MDKNILKDTEKNTGWLSIFRTVAFVGDSLSSGEVVSKDIHGHYEFNDYCEYSWGQFLARKYNFTAYNFSRGGMTAKEYTETFADRMRMWDPSKAAQAYFIALGVNDLLNFNHDPGTLADVHPDDHTKNPHSFTGCYATIISRYKKIQPRAKFFLVTMPKCSDDSEGVDEIKRFHRDYLYKLSELFDNVYIIDLYEYAPVYDERFRARHFMNGHLTPAGYLLTAEFIGKLADAVIDERIEKFRDVAFIGTDLVEKRD